MVHELWGATIGAREGAGGSSNVLAVASSGSPSPMGSRALEHAVRALAGGELFGSLLGAPEPARVLALHGWGRDRRDFFAALGGRSEAASVAVDLPGFGATPPPPEPWGSEAYARALLPVLESLAAPVVVVGHSFGGRVAVRLARAAPRLVGALVLSGAPVVRVPGAKRRPSARYRALRGARKLGLIGEERLERARRRYGSADYRAAEGVMRAVLVKLLAEEYEDDLRALACPVFLLWGEEDREVPVSVAHVLESTVPAGAELTVLAGVGHLVPTEAPEALWSVLQRALGVLR